VVQGEMLHRSGGGAEGFYFPEDLSAY